MMHNGKSVVRETCEIWDDSRLFYLVKLQGKLMTHGCAKISEKSFQSVSIDSVIWQRIKDCETKF